MVGVTIIGILAPIGPLFPIYNSQLICVEGATLRKEKDKQSHFCPGHRKRAKRPTP